MKWNSKLYDNKHQFVSKYGSKVLELLHPSKDESILDIGCGTGDLASELNNLGCQVVGIDSSADMIAKAKEKLPNLEFKVTDATDFQLDQKFDAVFSNAVFHWIFKKDHPKVLNCIKEHLKPNGRLVVEMGGGLNVKKIRDGVRQTLIAKGYEEQANAKIWFYPSKEEYQQLLEDAGFKVEFIKIIDRPTILDDERGLENWIEMFGDKWFKDIDKKTKNELLRAIRDRLHPELYKDGKWVADYKRLRFKATLNQ